MEQINTCQICGRSIKASKGVIAHHGYKRPQYGWQTASCYGARHEPYEVSSDALPMAIKIIEVYIERAKNDLIKFVSNPPEELTLPFRTYDNSRESVVKQRPANFHPDKIFAASMRSYESEYQSRRYQMEQDIKHASIHLEFMQQRLAKWVKVR